LFLSNFNPKKSSQYIFYDGEKKHSESRSTALSVFSFFFNSHIHHHIYPLYRGSLTKFSPRPHTANRMIFIYRWVNEKGKKNKYQVQEMFYIQTNKPNTHTRDERLRVPHSAFSFFFFAIASDKEPPAQASVRLYRGLVHSGKTNLPVSFEKAESQKIAV
jgi:hypothetical protein